MRCLLVVVVLAVVVSGCGSGEEAVAPVDQAGSSAGTTGSPVGATEACTERLLASVAEEDFESTSPDAIRDSIRRAYCEQFAREGWVYPDGALSIDAQRWLVAGRRCSTQVAGSDVATEVPCGDFPEGELPGTIECALLRHVRRSEVEAYLAELQIEGATCDDGTALAALGVP